MPFRSTSFLAANTAGATSRWRWFGGAGAAPNLAAQSPLPEAANPAALELLGKASQTPGTPFNLQDIHDWQGLARLCRDSFLDDQAQLADILIGQVGQGTRRIQVRTQVTATQAGTAERLCVMFLKDQREIEARMRKDRLASMARMSVAVAHEIRNPLAAISQANALLAEDILEPRHQQLIQMVHQNARRLEKIVDEVLNVTRLHSRKSANSVLMPLAISAQRVHQEWTAQNPGDPPALLVISCVNEEVFFEPDHLRQVLVNLLDNARRYASREDEAIQIHLEIDAANKTKISVWSNGNPMDQSVENHLFEPFFSSESRSTGLGLYICRELCENHGASIAYSRAARPMRDVRTEGNEFTITFRSPSPSANPSPRPQAASPEKWTAVRH